MIASRSGFSIQTKAMKYLLRQKEKRKLSSLFENLILKMQIEQSSYRQEHMIAHNIPLSLFLIN